MYDVWHRPQPRPPPRHLDQLHQESPDRAPGHQGGRSQEDRPGRLRQHLLRDTSGSEVTRVLFNANNRFVKSSRKTTFNARFSRGKRRAKRWYEHVSTGRAEILGREKFAGFDSEVPAEWESWLRHRRNEPPTEEQVKRHQLLEKGQRLICLLLSPGDAESGLGRDEEGQRGKAGGEADKGAQGRGEDFTSFVSTLFNKFQPIEYAVLSLYPALLAASVI